MGLFNKAFGLRNEVRLEKRGAVCILRFNYFFENQLFEHQF